MDDDTKTASPSRFSLNWSTQTGSLARTGGTALAAQDGAGGRAVQVPGTVADRDRRSFRISGKVGLILSFIAMVVLPTAIAGTYFGLIASNIYVSESKFAIRGPTERLPTTNANATSGVPGMGMLAGNNNSQDSYVVASYIRSTPLVEKLDRDQNIHTLFARNDVDFIARLKGSTSIERLRAYWNDKVSATVENISGILTLRVEAFTPQDALAISRAVLSASEALVNDMSARRLADAVKNANEEVVRSEQRLQAARLAVQAFRNSSGQIDPVKQSESTLTLLSTLRSEKIKLENEIATSRRTLNDRSPTVQVLTSRLQAMSDQIAGLERMVTSKSATDQTSSRALFQYEGLEVERQFAERLYLISQGGLERARMNANRQQLYFVTFVEPNLAERALAPRRLENILVCLVVAFALWSIVSLIAATVKDHFV